MRFIRIIPLLALALNAACSDHTSPLVVHPQGQYALSTIDGAALPVEIVHQAPPIGDGLTIYSGILSIRDDGTYVARTCYAPVPPQPCQFIALDDGHWSQRDGRTIVLSPSGDNAVERTLVAHDGRTLVERESTGYFAGFTATFTKQ